MNQFEKVANRAAARSTTVIDAPLSPAGRTRCLHDMLDGECAWCLGHDETDLYPVEGV